MSATRIAAIFRVSLMANLPPEPKYHESSLSRAPKQRRPLKGPARELFRVAKPYPSGIPTFRIIS
jgi:hypothetical protein